MPRKSLAASNAEPRSAEPGDVSGLSLEELHLRWRRQFGKAAPVRLPKHLLVRLFGYRLQAARHGDLPRETIRLLDQVADALERGKGGAVPIPDVQPIKAGTILVREHQGALQRVMVLEDGYAWNGRTWPSLSAVATAITGTRWNGHAFFGLKQRQGAKKTTRLTEPQRASSSSGVGNGAGGTASA